MPGWREGHSNRRNVKNLPPNDAIKPENYAILDCLEAYRQPIDGKIELFLCWPGTKIAPQHWRQKSNPYLHSGAVEGYEAVSCPHLDNAWGGLRSGHQYALLTGSTNEKWFYAVGAYQAWNDAIPGPNGRVDVVELYTRSNIHANWHLIMRQTKPKYWPKNRTLPLVPRTVHDNNYSVLDRLEAYRQPTDGKFEFLLCWPGTEIAPQHWRQKSNHAWGGLRSGQRRAVLTGCDCTKDKWFYAVGAYQGWEGSILVPNGPVKVVELWARQPPSSAHTADWGLIMRQTAPDKLWWLVA